LTEANKDLDMEIDDDEALNYLENLKDDEETKTNKTNKSRLSNASQKSARMKDIETANRVKALIRRGEDLRSETKSVRSNRSARSNRSQSRQESNRLIKKMEDQLAENNLEETRSQRSNLNENINANPLLKQSKSGANLVGKSVSSNKSLVSNTSLGKYVRSLKGELEKERNVKEKAINILKTLKNNNNNANIDDFLRTFTN